MNTVLRIVSSTTGMWASAALIARWMYPEELKFLLNALAVLAVVAAGFWMMCSRHPKRPLLFVTRILLFMCLMSGIGCYDPHSQESAIVRQVQRAGSGNLSTFTLPDLVRWFSLRPELAKQIALECVPLKQRADAHWVSSAEGTVCRAAEISTPPPTVLADQRAW